MVTQQGACDWTYVKLGDCLSFKNGLNKGKEYFGHGTPIINYMDVYANHVLTASDIEGTVEVTDSEIGRFEAKRNDVFFTRTSETPEEVGYASVLLDDIDDCVFSGFVLRGRPTSSKLYPGYCAYCFMSWPVRSEIERNCTYTTRALTNGKVLSAIEMPLPPYKEQMRIAEALSDIDELIEGLEKLLEKKKSIKNGTMQELLTGKRRLPGFDGEWNSCRLRDISKSISGGTPSTQNASFWDGRIPWISSSDLISGSIEIATTTRHISEEAIARSATTICKGPTIHVVVRVGLGKVAISQGGIATSQDFCNLVDIKGDVVFLGYFLMRQMNEIAKSAQGTSIQGIRSRDLFEKEILLPSSMEQHAIAVVLSDMDAEISLFQEKLDKYKYLRAGMIDDLLTGRIRLLD